MKNLILIIAAQIILLAITASARDSENFAKTMNPKDLGLHKMEKLTHLRFYWHDYAKGRNRSAVMINQPVLNSTTSFGSVSMFDDLLTMDKTKNSTVVAHAQGIYAGASEEEISYLMAMNFAFKTGKYNGSTITILGRSPVFEKVREMPIVGGSGIFRFARGYVELRTVFFDFPTGESNVEFNCYVLH